MNRPLSSRTVVRSKSFSQAYSSSDSTLFVLHDSSFQNRVSRSSSFSVHKYIGNVRLKHVRLGRKISAYNPAKVRVLYDWSILSELEFLLEKQVEEQSCSDDHIHATGLREMRIGECDVLRKLRL